MKKVVVAILWLSSILFAEVKVGDVFPSLTLVDPFNTKVDISKEGEAKFILSFEKEISSEIQVFLETKKKDYLSKNNILYIVDLSSIPSLMRNWFAIPKMKKFDFKVALMYDKKEAKILMRKSRKVTIVWLKDNVVTDIKFLTVDKFFSLF
jgi:hypothetical protein